MKIKLDKNIKGLSKFISKILRHEPKIINIKLDDYGYADVNELINGINENSISGKRIDFETLKYIVENDNKQRYSFNCDCSKIRANQGHSIPVDLKLKAVEPPDKLYHGTGEKFLDSIFEKGILSQKRQYVHLSKDCETAKVVGSRHGKPKILEINTKKMYEDGYKFYLSENKVWLTRKVPTEYISLI